MAKYYLNLTPQHTKEKEIHKDGCFWLSKANDTEYLGEFTGCQGALAEARRRHPFQPIDGCADCCNKCHSR